MTSLYSVVLKLKSENEALISPTQGYHAYALFLDLMRQSSPDLAEALHQSPAVKPFTVSSLQGSFPVIDKKLKVVAQQAYTIRLTFLNEEIFCHFMDAVLKASGKPLRLESAGFRIQELVTTDTGSPLCRFQQYEELVKNAACENRITLHFDSPTTFRSGGKRNILFPEPLLVLGSYFNRWQAFSPLKLKLDMEKYREKISISRYKLNTRILHFNGYQETGFTGSCSLDLANDLTEEEIREINTLADFSFYCGTGAKTAMGMGQTRRVYDR